ncbi:MAG: hypothetical protein FWH43_04920 [Endomicrobia bacterium]|nr:hypothetical protein [Endomicrobiia bacterium]
MAGGSIPPAAKKRLFEAMKNDQWQLAPECLNRTVNFEYFYEHGSRFLYLSFFIKFNKNPLISAFQTALKI